MRLPTRCTLLVVFLAALSHARASCVDIPPDTFTKGPEALDEYLKKNIEAEVPVGEFIPEDIVPALIKKEVSTNKFIFFYLGPYCYLIVPADTLDGVPPKSIKGRIVRVKGELKRMAAGRSRLGGLTYKYILDARQFAPAFALVPLPAKAIVNAANFREYGIPEINAKYEEMRDRACRLQVDFSGLLPVDNALAEAVGISAPEWKMIAHVDHKGLPHLFVHKSTSLDTQALMRLPARHPVTVYGRISCVPSENGTHPAVVVDMLEFEAIPPADGGHNEYIPAGKHELIERVMAKPGQRIRITLVFRGITHIPGGTDALLPALTQGGGWRLDTRLNGFPDRPFDIVVAKTAESLCQKLKHAEKGDTIVLDCLSSITRKDTPALLVEDVKIAPILRRTAK